MTPAEYILDHRFETLCCVAAIEHEDPIFLERNEIVRFLLGIKTPYCFISHNALFDATILSYVYNIHPPALLCTMNMARALMGYKLKRGSVALGNIMEHLGMPGKSDALQNTKGMHWDEIKADAGLFVGFVGYARKDMTDCRHLFFHMRPHFPPQEAMIMDRVIRMTTQPRLHADIHGLMEYHKKIVRDKKTLLQRVNRDKSSLMSNPQFAESLLSLGVEPPMKISPITGKNTFAFARTDEEFMELLEHDNPDVQALVAARLGIKSTLEESRTMRFYNIAALTQREFLEPLMPVPLKYSGAHTHRLSGDWKLNMQNLASRKSKELRKQLKAAPGHLLVSVDASQIEARLTAWLAEQWDLLRQFANGEDVYSNFASLCFNRVVTKADELYRFVGKTCILGLGFGMSALRLLRTLQIAARDLGLPAKFDLEDTQYWVNLYRTTFSDIPVLWQYFKQLIEDMLSGAADGRRIGPCVVVDGTAIMLPSGLKLHYHNLRFDEGEYWYTDGDKRKKIYGAKMCENVVQSLDRQHVMEAQLRTERRALQEHDIDASLVLQEHDANVMMVPAEKAMMLAQIAFEEMRRPCRWGAGLPLGASVKIGANLGEMEEMTL